MLELVGSRGGGGGGGLFGGGAVFGGVGGAGGWVGGGGGGGGGGGVAFVRRAVIESGLGRRWGVGIGALWEVLDHVGWEALGRKFCLNHASGRRKQPAGARFSG